MLCVCARVYGVFISLPSPSPTPSSLPLPHPPRISLCLCGSPTLCLSPFLSLLSLSLSSPSSILFLCLYLPSIFASLPLSLPLSTCLFPSIFLPLFSFSFLLSILRPIHRWDPAPFFPQPFSLTRPPCPTPTNQICNLIQLYPAKLRCVTLLISRLLEGGEEKIKIDFVLLLIRKIETLHLRRAEQHVVATDVGSLHSCTGRGVESVPKPASFLSCKPLHTATSGLMTPSEARRPGPAKGSSAVWQLRS